MDRTPLSLDTSDDAERIQIARWRQMTPEQKLELVAGMSRAVFELAKAGIRERYPHSSPREHFLRFAILTLGPELAQTAYPEIAQLDLSD